MSFDYNCQTVIEQNKLLERLGEIEATLKEVKDGRKKEEIRDERKKIFEVLCDKHFSLFYQYIKGLENLDEDADIRSKKYDTDAFRRHWLEFNRTKLPFHYSEQKLMELQQDIIPVIDLRYMTALPKYSFAIQFEFTLAKPYISKDEQEFYIIDNPVKKDWVFKVPMVSPSTWKGNLRWVMRKNKGKIDSAKPEDDDQLNRLFGNEKESEEGFRGRLTFFPTFFNGIDVEVINPHDRKTKAGTKPIFIEVVPPSTEDREVKGIFTILYIPFDLIGKEKDEKIASQAKKDLGEVTRTIKDLLFKYGFSAKRSSGTGVIKDSFFRENCKVFFNVVTVPDEDEQQVAKGLKIKDLADLKQVLPKDVTFEYIERKVQEIIKELENQDE